MIRISREEKQATLFLKGSAAVYFLVGLAFIFFPDPILSLFNRLSAYLFPTLPLTPIGGEHFWTALAFSMMMTIAAICFAAQHNIRKYRHLVVILLVSKSASSLSALMLFLLQSPKGSDSRAQGRAKRRPGYQAIHGCSPERAK